MSATTPTRPGPPATITDDATRARLQGKYERTAAFLGTTLADILDEFGVPRLDP
ncbi:hypothetical protein [Curtobacterium sp. MCPF17_021]|uniref:hypothetical protein n=1 Tax=Curtobacterium sp. MCPF17_021 TaxID=2175639 RepID=UPI0015E88791|nr:hypothetical protein [Curtobacterium sp. MCPF17_021]WIE82817.1 hypothetical protein DEJ29_015730 [Curtobacterium sp. MCPF17_021]